MGPKIRVKVSVSGMTLFDSTIVVPMDANQIIMRETYPTFNTITPGEIIIVEIQESK